LEDTDERLYVAKELEIQIGPTVGSRAITVTFDTRPREVLIFLKELRPHTVADFERSGVTRREAEILYWIGRGKTDPEIARLLSISPRTVQKHIEHIFAKLGVETRTAAVMRSLELIG
jgi:DNA-binding CsgD family transcriptional regulator